MHSTHTPMHTPTHTPTQRITMTSTINITSTITITQRTRQLTRQRTRSACDGSRESTCIIVDKQSRAVPPSGTPSQKFVDSDLLCISMHETQNDARRMDAFPHRDCPRKNPVVPDTPGLPPRLFTSPRLCPFQSILCVWLLLRWPQDHPKVASLHANGVRAGETRHKQPEGRCGDRVPFSLVISPLSVLPHSVWRTAAVSKISTPSLKFGHRFSPAGTSQGRSAGARAGARATQERSRSASRQERRAHGRPVEARPRARREIGSPPLRQRQWQPSAPTGRASMQ